MHLPGGIPTISDLDELKKTDFYQRHVDFNRQFLQRHHDAMAGYGRHWGLDPFKLWSRRWEYPFVAQRLMDFAHQNPSDKLRILDAGSGVTYFPYFILDQLPQAEFICCDYDSTYSSMFDRINIDRKCGHVGFIPSPLQKLPLENDSLDAICCISVLEHTDNYGQIIEEFARVLRPGGLLVLTFDLSLDGKFTLPRGLAAELLRSVWRRFDLPGGFDVDQQLNQMRDRGNLTTNHVLRTEPKLLPWSFPVRVYKAIGDLLSGRGWTTGFRSRTVFCVDAIKKSS